MTTLHLNGLGQQEVYTKIRNVFLQQYSDLGIYRYMNRYKTYIKVQFGVSFLIVLVMGLTGYAWPIAWWAFAFIGLITLGGIDHFWIGLRYKRMINILSKEGITIDLTTLQDTCKDIMPN